MGIILDLIILAIIVIFAFLSAKKGFVRTLIELVGFFLAIFIASSISPAISNGVYDKFIEPAIVDSVDNIQIEDSVIGNVTVSGTEDYIPDFVKKLLGENFSIEAFEAKISENIQNGTRVAVTTASREVIKPIVITLLNAIFTLLISVILMFIFGIVAKFVNKLFSFSIIGKLNKILGALLGMIKGGIVSSVVAAAISFLITVSPNGFLFFTADAVADSVIFKLFSFTNFL